MVRELVDKYKGSALKIFIGLMILGMLPQGLFTFLGSVVTFILSLAFWGFAAFALFFVVSIAIGTYKNMKG